MTTNEKKLVAARILKALPCRSTKVEVLEVLLRRAPESTMVDVLRFVRREVRAQARIVVELAR